MRRGPVEDVEKIRHERGGFNPNDEAGVTSVLMAIDRSGSMYQLAEDVRGGFNTYIDNLRADNFGTVVYKVTAVTFAYRSYPYVTAASPGAVPPMTEANYEPGGGTALYDAVGALITGHTAQAGERVLVVVNTDGKENSSIEWTFAALHSLIADKKEQGWEFVYLGAGVGTWEGERLGMSGGQTVNTSGGTRGTYSGLYTGTRKFSQGASGQSVAAEVAAASVAEDEADNGR